MECQGRSVRGDGSVSCTYVHQCCGIVQDEEVGLIAKDFSITEHDIVNKTMLAKKFFEKLVKQLETGLEDMTDQYAALA